MTENLMGKEFSYGKSVRILTLIPFVQFAIGFPLLVIAIIAAAIRIILSLLTNTSITVGFWVELIGLCLALWFVLLLPVSLINTYNSIRVTRFGLLVRVFRLVHYKWILIPWEDVIGLELSHRLDRWLQPVWIIKVKRLTIWHRFISKEYGGGSQPGVIITSDMENRGELIEIIKGAVNGKITIDGLYS